VTSLISAMRPQVTMTLLTRTSASTATQILSPVGSCTTFRLGIIHVALGLQHLLGSFCRPRLTLRSSWASVVAAVLEQVARRHYRPCKPAQNACLARTVVRRRPYQEAARESQAKGITSSAAVRRASTCAAWLLPSRTKFLCSRLRLWS
jgi:hypothetical protein